MSKKWNPFSRKKGSKVDSHGTTLANEEMIFQPAVRLGQDSQWRVNSSSIAAKNRGSFPSMNVPQEETRRVSSVVNVGNMSQLPIDHRETVTGATQIKNVNLLQTTSNEPTKHNHHKYNSYMGTDNKKMLDPNRTNAFDPHPIIPVANISRTSPRVAKKLIKPGTINPQQPSFLTPTTNAMGVSISDEYTDPFDAVHVNKANTGQSNVDGYIEPYEAQQMYHDATHANVEEKNGASVSKKELYDDPWDKTRQSTGGNHQDYEEPWDKAETLPFAANRHPNSATNNKEKLFPSRHGELAMECPAPPGTNSGGSSTSSSSVNLAKHRMVKVDFSPRQSPQNSPHQSPKLDRRLIRPKEPELSAGRIDPRLQLCDVSAGASKYKPVDRRLIKAEPSYGEMRKNSSFPNARSSSKNSSKTNSPIGSAHASSNSSPVNTLVPSEALDRLSDEASRRASSPLVQPMNVSHYLLNKAKSRSLDIRNRQYLPNVRGASGGLIPKSASDDQLSHASAITPPCRGNPVLVGVTEYDEPWDGDSYQNKSPVRPNIAHSRSRSYELSSSSANMYARHGKSHSFNKQSSDPAGNMEYEQPWDQHEVLPKTHMESMQRFQHRQLELHPSEAISHRDFDPLIPLEKQSWFHGSITRDKANQRLENEIEGSYLVRISESVRNSYSLSLRAHNDTIHMVISRTRDGFWILGEFSTPFHSIPEMITFYAAHRLRINDSQHISLRYPLPEEFL